MSDYSQQNSQNFSQSSAFAAALQRAKQIAAKIHPGGQPGKRSLEEGSEPESKKFGASDYNNASSPTGMSPAAMQAAAQAAAVAARLAQSNPNSSINSSQGPQDPVQRARDLINKMVNQGGNNGQQQQQQMDNGNSPQSVGGGGGGGGRASFGGSGGNSNSNYAPYQEIMIPGSKVGLIIGKGGETIKQLQEKTGAKMVIIQDGPGQEMEKPLRISGDPQKVEHAKQLVYELIQEKDQYTQRPNLNGGEQAEVFVPKAAVGVVIGKGGDMIKKIQGESGCKLQFIQGRGDGPGDRRCIVQGTKQQVDDGKQMIEELIDSVLRREGQGPNQGRGNGNGNNGGESNYSSYTGPQVTREEYTFAVPASKCGIIIGRGGDTIKQINQQSGAYCEMDRKASATQTAEKTFTCKGEPHQVEEAKRLISEKINIEINMTYVGSTTVPANQAYGNQNNGQSAYQQQNWSYTPQWEQGGQQPQVPVNQAQGSADYSQQWIEYYKQMGMHREAEMIEQQVKARQGPQASTPQPTAAPNQNMPAQAVMAGASMAGSAASAGGAGAADYSAEWAEYYRRIGKVDEAEAIEKQIQANKMQVTGPSAGGGGAAPYNIGGGQQQQQIPQAGYGGAQAQYPQFYGGAGGQPGYPGYPYGAYPGQQGGQPGQPGAPGQEKN